MTHAGGRPPKPGLTSHELELALSERRLGNSWQLIANEISRLRKADSAISPEVRRRRAVSRRWVRIYVQNAGKTLSGAKLDAPSEPRTSGQNSATGDFRDAVSHQEAPK